MQIFQNCSTIPLNRSSSIAGPHGPMTQNLCPMPIF